LNSVAGSVVKSGLLRVDLIRRDEYFAVQQRADLRQAAYAHRRAYPRVAIDLHAGDALQGVGDRRVRQLANAFGPKCCPECSARRVSAGWRESCDWRMPVTMTSSNASAGLVPGDCVSGVSCCADFLRARVVCSGIGGGCLGRRRRGGKQNHGNGHGQRVIAIQVCHGVRPYLFGLLTN